MRATLTPVLLVVLAFGTACLQTKSTFTCDACTVVCGTKGKTCAQATDCCPGFSCYMGACACADRGEQCGPNLQACAGLTCDPAGFAHPTCGSTTSCQPMSGPCAVDSDCCANGVCKGGVCNDPADALNCSLEGGPCTAATDCCGSTAFGSRPDCIADGGRTYCHFGQPGEACDGVNTHCTPGLTCIFPSPPPPPDAGPGADAGAGSDGGTDDGGMSGSDGGDDAGAGVDAGSPPDAGAPPDAGLQMGVCNVPPTGNNCTIFTANCTFGDACDPTSATNQNFDPCSLVVINNQLNTRTTASTCNFGYCTLPLEGQQCDSTCIQTNGDSRQTVCADFYDGSKTCAPACSTDSDCKFATLYDGQIANPQPVTNYCMNYGTVQGCQPDICYADGVMGLSDAGALYQPCERADTLCLPRYSGAFNLVVGFCTATRSTPGPTVGQACNPGAGREATAALCGADATCLGGQCAQLCDASQLGQHGTPVCTDPTKTCISPQNVDLVAAYQFGGCGDTCDPFADLEHSGCWKYCGGPPARCTWIIGDASPAQPRGYCGPAVEVPIPAGQPCVGAPVDPCAVGSMCLFNATGGSSCVKLCDPNVSTGDPDSCPNGQTCTAFRGFKKSGFCM